METYDNSPTSMWARLGFVSLNRNRPGACCVCLPYPDCLIHPQLGFPYSRFDCPRKTNLGTYLNPFFCYSRISNPPTTLIHRLPFTHSALRSANPPPSWHLLITFPPSPDSRLQNGASRAKILGFNLIEFIVKMFSPPYGFCMSPLLSTHALSTFTREGDLKEK